MELTNSPSPKPRDTSAHLLGNPAACRSHRQEQEERVLRAIGERTEPCLRNVEIEDPLGALPYDEVRDYCLGVLKRYSTGGIWFHPRDVDILLREWNLYDKGEAPMPALSLFLRGVFHKHAADAYYQDYPRMRDILVKNTKMPLETRLKMMVDHLFHHNATNRWSNEVNKNPYLMVRFHEPRGCASLVLLSEEPALTGIGHTSPPTVLHDAQSMGQVPPLSTTTGGIPAVSTQLSVAGEPQLSLHDTLKSLVGNLGKVVSTVDHAVNRLEDELQVVKSSLAAAKDDLELIKTKMDAILAVDELKTIRSTPARQSDDCPDVILSATRSPPYEEAKNPRAAKRQKSTGSVEYIGSTSIDSLHLSYFS